MVGGRVGLRGRGAVALGLALALAGTAALAAGGTAATDVAALPPEVRTALEAARVPAAALSVVVEEAGSGRPVLSWNAGVPVNPASLTKLVTTAAALDTLGPAWRWRTPVWLLGELRDGVLDGSLAVRGSGDPTLVLERVWLLLRRLQQLGVREIRGDIVLDRSAFDVPDADPGAFDGEPLRPYNTQPDALLLNFKTVTYGFVPDPALGRARVTQTPALAGAGGSLSVPLSSGPCADWRGGLRARFDARAGARFDGVFPAACGEREWPVADPEPATYNARLIEGLWREMGGRLGGRARDGAAPGDRAPDFELSSPPLAEVVRDINKFSNNVMARQLFLSLDAADGRAATEAGARARLTGWLVERTGAAPSDVRLDNGAGLSRDARMPAAMLAGVLQQAWRSPVMPELMASLPVSGLDGTLRRARMAAGRAHLKTGSLRDVAGLAGYVLSDGGQRFVVVAIVNHPEANAARPALDALARWVMSGPPPRPEPGPAAR